MDLNTTSEQPTVTQPQATYKQEQEQKQARKQKKKSNKNKRKNKNKKRRETRASAAVAESVAATATQRSHADERTATAAEAAHAERARMAFFNAAFAGDAAGVVHMTRAHPRLGLVRMRDAGGRTALLYAARGRDVDGGRGPRGGLNEGANVGSATESARVTCTAAAATVRALLDLGADANARCHAQGMTALHWAAGEGAEAVAEELLRRGADPFLRDREGKMAIQYATGREQQEALLVIAKRMEQDKRMEGKEPVVVYGVA